MLALALSINAFTTSSVSYAETSRGMLDEESFPIVGAISTNIRWNHSVFQENGSSPEGDEYGVGESQGFGWSVYSGK